MNAKSRSGLFILCMFALFGISPSWATTALPRDLESLFSSASVVLEARCLEVRQESTAPYYVVTWEVERMYKGKVESQHLTTRVPGGRLGGYTVYVPGWSLPSVGERAVVFLSDLDPQGHRRIFGGTAGMMTVTIREGKEVLTFSGQRVDLPSFRMQLDILRSRGDR